MSGARPEDTLMEAGAAEVPGPGIGGDVVARWVGRFEAAVAEAHRRLATAIEEDVARPLVAAAGGAAEEHALLLAASGLESLAESPEAARAALADPAERERVWRAALDYRRAVRTRVLDPLADRLAALDVGHRVAELRARTRAAVDDAAADAPESLTREEPEDTFLPRPGDPVRRRTGKALVRARRRLGAVGRGVSNLGRRVTRRAPEPPPERRQDIPLRALLRYHVVARLASEEEGVVESLRRRLARYVGDWERDASGWADAMLELDAILDRPAHHAAPGAPPATPAPGDPDPPAPAAPAEDDTATEESAARLVAAVEAAAALGMALESLAAAEPLSGMVAELEAGAAAVRLALLGDLGRAGTFMLDPAERALPDEPPRSARAAGAQEERWVRWFRQVVARMELDGQLERVRDRVLALLDDHELHLADAVVDPARALLRSGHEAVADIRRQVEEGVVRARTTGDPAPLRARLSGVREDVTAALQARVLEPLATGELVAAVREHADATVGEIVALLDSLPESLTVHEPAGPLDEPEPDGKPVEVRLRPIAGQAYDAVLLERFRLASDPLAVALDRARAEVRQLESVIRFNVEAALDELDPAPTGEEGGVAAPGRDAPQAPGLDARLDGARELALNGLDRTLHALDDLMAEIPAELPVVRQRLFDAHVRGWDQVHDRVRVEDRMQEQILDFGYRARTALRSALAEARTGTARATRRGARLLRLGRGRARRLVRLGQTALEGERITEEQKRRTIDALSTVDAVLGDLPLVYRRLFSFQPVTDPGLLEGRAADLTILERHFAHWRQGLTDAFVVTGYDGNGRTSFLNVVQDTVLADVDVRRLPLPERVLDEGELAGRLAAVLGVEGAGDWTLDRLAVRLLERGREGRPVACVVENLEHLFLRTSAGNGLIGEFLGFMSKADSCVFWLATLAEPAWSYVEKVEPTTAALVRRHALTPMTRPDLEAMIVSRHLRSGLDLEFEAPAPPPPLLRRRLAKAAGEVERQEILRGEYFDQLYRLAGQNLLLALFHWVRSVDLDARTGVVRVRAAEPISFAFMDAFTLSQSFTLKAFLDHATLTLAEHQAIFRSSRQESHNLFESLGNLLVIERADVGQRVSEFHFTTIEPERRYRIRPLVVHPVLVHLRGRNIVA